MKKTYVLILALLSIIPALKAQQRFNFNINLENVNREFIVIKPSGAIPAGGYPMVLVLHGTGGNGDNFQSKSGWKEKAEAEKFVAVFPSALPYCVVENNDGSQENTAKWMNGGTVNVLCPNNNQTLRNDVHFIRKIVDTLKKTVSINPKKIYAAGFSNGAAMTAKLAVEATDIFAAIACSSSVLNALDSAKPTIKRPIWFVIGTEDDKFIRAPWKEIPYGGDSSLAYFNAPLNRFLEATGLTNSYTKTTTNNFITYAYSTPKAGEKPNLFKYTLVKNMPHIYPNGNNHPISSADVFWEFFNQYTLTPTEELTVGDEKLVRIYPNPANAFTTIDLSAFNTAKTLDITVFNAVGQAVSTQKGSFQESFILKNDNFGKGFFLVKIQIDNQLILKKVMFE
jgi:polyhydroxybutyrate depolymerase